ncbi:MAG: isoprenoid biosynthesis glyoxalase ElbB [Colwellia sp.]|nr:isoprenoid biosynthesis glyoxalase ElbB [Colwellia sp.]
MKRIAIILSGCGVYDGSEIHESVLTLLAIEQQGATYRCFAPNINQHHVINHLTGEVKTDETRNVLVESARISRGDIEDVVELYQDEFDALIFPGGFGAAKNLCTFALDAENYQINAEVLTAAQSFIKAEKPLGFMCIAPAMIPLVFGENAQGTIGKDRDIAASLMNRGLVHVDCEVDDIIVDEERKLVSTPAYMLATSLVEAASGINKLVKKVISLC